MANKPCILAFCMVLVCVGVVYAQSDFIDWMKKEHKSYGSYDEKVKRMNIFKQNLDRFKQQSGGEGEVVYAPDSFSDLTPQEWAELVLDPVLRNVNLTAMQKNLPKVKPPAPKQSKRGTLKNWCAEGFCTAPKNHHSPLWNDGGILRRCGACWVASTTALIETYDAIAGRGLSALSMQQSLDCAPFANIPPSYYSPCTGGYPIDVIKYTRSNRLTTESVYAWTAQPVSCKFNPAVMPTPGVVSTWAFLNTETDMLNWINTRGPVLATLDAAGINGYVSGVVSGGCSTTPNHAVVVVGHGTTSTGVPYWIVRNGWGASWGESGFFRIKRGVNMCGIGDGGLVACGADDGCGMCIHKTCASFGAGACGYPDDGCGTVLDCGTCASPQAMCSLDTNQCCTPQTCSSLNRVCGNIPIGCGWADTNCGTCSSGTCFVGRCETPPSALSYFPLPAPYRAFDTRNTQTPVPAATATKFAIMGAVPGLPADAISIDVSFVIIGPTAAGWMGAVPYLAPGQSPSTSNCLFDANANKACQFIVTLGPGGSVSVFSSQQTHMLADVNGYFSAQAGGLMFTPFSNPIRLVDTRGSTCHPDLSGPLESNRVYTVQLNNMQCEGSSIPSSAVALASNLVSVGAASGGWLSIWPGPSLSPPATSVLNYPAQVAIANSATVTLSSTGTANVMAVSPTHLIIDASGYWSANGAYKFYPFANPKRLLDTRSYGPMLKGGIVYSYETIAPSVAKMIVGGIQVIGPTASGWAQIWPAVRGRCSARVFTHSQHQDGAIPSASAINWEGGKWASNSVIVRTSASAGKVSVRLSCDAHVIIDVVGYMA